MNNLFKINDWLVIEEGFHPGINREAESIFSLGNGYMGQRANFEEHYSGDSLQGSYVAGIYYPDKTRVGWWKNGYPEYFAKVLNSPNWIGIDVGVEGVKIDLALTKTGSFRRVLNMREGYLERSFIITLPRKGDIKINSRRFLSMAEPDLGLIEYRLESVSFDGSVELTSYLDSDVRNEDTNYNENFWKNIYHHADADSAIITSKTLKTGFHLALCMVNRLEKNDKEYRIRPGFFDKQGFVGHIYNAVFKPGDQVTLRKYVSVQSSLNHPEKELADIASERAVYASGEGFERLFAAHRREWERIWSTSDVVIEGDNAAQQGVRFNIFHLNQTYTGKDERLNIGPKGFTGEKYGGSTYWDTEAFVLPFFLKTAPGKLSRNLVLYRYRHLQKSIENARKLGFKNGAALYPMVTMNGEECHNEWEITFEEIHRNGAIAFAIFNYIRHTGDEDYMASYGLEVLIALSRFWSQRVSYSERLNKFMILGVTGPNEYENNVNNNWYTNTIATWTLSYTIDSINKLKASDPQRLKKITDVTGFNAGTEINRWNDIIENMHFPYDKERKVFIQQDGFLDKELKHAADIPVKERPVNQHWSWDRILRSCFIKQADVLQGLYFFEDHYDTETIKRNFDFYEPMTVHESSLSASVHSIIASRIGYTGKAYDLYLRTSRLDLDDYNREVAEGLHITSMSGSWLAIVEGFGGMRILHDRVYLNPLIPEKWDSFSFHVRFREIPFKVKVTVKEAEITNLSDKNLPLNINGNICELKGMERINIKINR
jgi:maltose phosphorylase